MSKYLFILSIFFFSKQSFNDIEMWLKELKTHANPDIKVFLIGNKIDLIDNRKVSAEEAKKFKEDYMLNLYMETSAKTGFNAKEIFIEAAKVLYKEYNKYKKIDEEKKPEYEILPDDYPKYDLSFKIIIIGNSGVGKSCLSVKATKNVFENNYLATVGFEFFNFNIKLGERVIRLQIWDTCGQEIYRSLITNFYRNSSLAFIVFAIDE